MKTLNSTISFVWAPEEPQAEVIRFDYTDNYTPTDNQIVFLDNEVFMWHELHKTFYPYGDLVETHKGVYRFTRVLARDSEYSAEILTDFYFVDDGWGEWKIFHGDHLIGYAYLLDEGFYIEYINYSHLPADEQWVYNHRL